MGIGRTQLRVVLALLLTGMLPLLSAITLANTIVQRVTQVAFQPEFADQLDRSLELYADLVHAMKRSMRMEGALIASDDELRRVTEEGDEGALRATLARLRGEHESALSLTVVDVDGEVLGEVKRPAPVDDARERAFTVPAAIPGTEAQLTAVFAADTTAFIDMEAANKFVIGWKAFAQDSRDHWVARPYVSSFAAIFGLTVILSVIVGVLVMRPSVRRIQRLAKATEPVAEGDLSVRVAEDGNDEIAELAQSFNRMLADLEQSRARVEFLRRVGEWQNMARRLAHEIKNPLTPIQLAVEECHGRYQGDDGGYQKLLDTTRDIVVEEVASLRRLVTEFSAFARLPRAEPRPGDLVAFLEEQRPRLERELGAEATLRWSLPDDPVEVGFDRTMLYRALSNLVHNGVQAAEGEAVEVEVTLAAEGERVVLSVDDDGPGIPDELVASLFDPYVTTKKEGTGLGLTIVKKVVIDHGGTIIAAESPGGGASFRISLPRAGSLEAVATSVAPGA